MEGIHYFYVISKYRMYNHYRLKLLSCIRNLDHNQLWCKESITSNCIGGITLHVLEHITRSRMRLSNPTVTFGLGIEEHFPNSGLVKEELLEQVEQFFADLKQDMEISNEENFDMYNTYHLVEHTGYHLGQIVDRTQRLTGKRMNFVQSGINEKELKKLINDE